MLVIFYSDKINMKSDWINWKNFSEDELIFLEEAEKIYLISKNLILEYIAKGRITGFGKPAEEMPYWPIVPRYIEDALNIGADKAPLGFYAYWDPLKISVPTNNETDESKEFLLSFIKVSRKEIEQIQSIEFKNIENFLEARVIWKGMCFATKNKVAVIILKELYENFKSGNDIFVKKSSIFHSEASKFIDRLDKEQSIDKLMPKNEWDRLSRIIEVSPKKGAYRLKS